MKGRLAGLLLLSLVASGGTPAQGLPPGLYQRLQDIRGTMDNGESGQALPRLQALLEEARGDDYAEAVVRQHLGYGYLQTRRPTEAARELSRALELGTLPVEVEQQLHLLLAQAAMQQNRPSEALPHVRAWLAAIASPTPEQQAMAAQILYAAGRIAEAADWLQRAIAAGQASPGGWIRSLLGMYLELRAYEKARQLLRDSIRRQPGEADYWRYLAAVEHQAGRPSKALEVMALAYRQGLLEADELSQFARLHANQGMPEKAARLLQQWRQSGRLATSAPALRTEADLWLMARERDQALDLLREAGNLGDDGGDDYQRGRILFDAGRWRESERALEQALRRGGLADAHQAQLLAGIAALQSGEEDRAKVWLTGAAGHADTMAQARAWLAVLDDGPSGKR
jgi:tetratricopeptide (TPR) repeat protein